MRLALVLTACVLLALALVLVRPANVREGVNAPHTHDSPGAKDSTMADGNRLAAPAPSRTAPAVASRHRPAEQWRSRATWLGPFDVTAYSHTGHKTASGKWPAYGMVANNHYAFGTRVEIEGLGIFTVEDRIGGGTDWDVFLDTRAQCIRWGRRHLRVRVVG